MLLSSFSIAHMHIVDLITWDYIRKKIIEKTKFLPVLKSVDLGSF